MSDEHGRTFINACLSGDAFLDDIDAWVEQWHSSPDDGPDLDTFLGFRDDEGALWAERPEALRFIVAAHRREVPVRRVIAAQDEWALAARAGSEGDAQAVLEWLRRNGRL